MHPMVKSDKIKIVGVFSWEANEPPRNGADHRMRCLLAACNHFSDFHAVTAKKFKYSRSYGPACEVAARWAWLRVPATEFFHKDI